MHVLLIAPSAPPKNSPEAMQVGRFLKVLDPLVRVTLVTTPVAAGWEWQDATVELARERLDLRVITLTLPAHGLTQRILANRRLSALHIPDSDYWLSWFVGYVAEQLDGVPDVIYSRSAPFSAALLARGLTRRLGRPWMMHLSDPWADSPYRALPPRRAAADRVLEAGCIAEADLIALTTEGQAEYYRARYPSRADAIIVTPNMMPLLDGVPPPTPRGGPFRLVYTGALYGAREPSTLLAALHILRESAPDVAAQITLDFYGNVSSEIAALLYATPGCVWHGPVSSIVAAQAQASADALLTIEPGGDHPLLLHFMPSKNLDYIAHRKIILAITPCGSETARLCAAGYGWAVAPGDAVAMADRLVELVRIHTTGAPPSRAPDPMSSPYTAETVTSSVLDALRELTSRGSEKVRT